MEIDEVIRRAAAIRDELSGVVVAQDEALDQVVLGLLAGGHVLLEGPPGTAKTLLVRALAMAIRGRFGRIQFTPDLMPADITGVNIFQDGGDGFVFHPGPVFCDLLLADEVNRAPAKTQSALLEAMQEAQVSVDGATHPLSAIFTAFATQNPIEYEGTYPLPEAQLDRFMLKVLIGYPGSEGEQRMLERHQGGFDAARPETFGIEPRAGVEEVQAMRAAVRALHVEPPILRYITAVVCATREHHAVMLGGSPRAAVMLLAASRAMAVLRQRRFVTPDDVRDCAAPVLRHRLMLNPEAEIEGTTADDCVGAVLSGVEVPRLD